MNQIIENLLQIKALALRSCQNPSGDRRIKKLRKMIPAEVLLHYDRLLERGKLGVAFVRNGVCGQCHMQVAVGLLASLHRLEDIHRCQNCGVYLSVVEETPMEMPVRSVKPGRRVTKLLPPPVLTPTIISASA